MSDKDKKDKNDKRDEDKKKDKKTYHPYTATNEYLEEHRPLHFINENELKKMKYGTMVKLTAKYDSGKTYSTYGFFIYYNNENKKIFYSILHPWSLPTINSICAK